MKQKIIFIGTISLLVICSLFVQTTLAFLVKNEINSDNQVNAATLAYEVCIYDNLSETTEELSKDINDPTKISQNNLLLKFTNIGSGDIKIYYEVVPVGESSETTESIVIKNDDTTSKETTVEITLNGSNKYELRVYYEYASSSLNMPPYS